MDIISDEYKTVTSEIAEGFYSEKRSKFYAFVHHVTSEDEIKAIIAGYHKSHYDARHICYAYVLGSRLVSEQMMMVSRVVLQGSLYLAKL